MGQNTVGIWIAAALQYLLITVKVVTLGKVSFSDTQNPQAHIDSHWKTLSAY